VNTPKPSKKRELILEAATNAFRDRGYEATSMDHVAELAMVSKRTVYNHFGSKEVLFRAVVDGLIAHSQALKQIEFDAGRPLDAQLHDFAAAKARVATDPALAGLMRVVIGVFVRDPEFARDAVTQAAAGEDALVRWLQAASAAGKLRVADPQLAAELFWSMVGGGVFWPHVLGFPVDPAGQQRLMEEAIATFLARHAP